MKPICPHSKLLYRMQTFDRSCAHTKDLTMNPAAEVPDCCAITDFYTTHKVSSTPVHAASKAVLSGTDVECVWENYPYKNLPEGVEKGLIKDADIDKSLMRILKGRFELGDFDDDAIVPWAQLPPSILNSEKHKNLTYQMAQQTMTLLQN